MSFSQFPDAVFKSDTLCAGLDQAATLKTRYEHVANARQPLVRLHLDSCGRWYSLRGRLMTGAVRIYSDSSLGASRASGAFLLSWVTSGSARKYLTEIHDR